MVDRSLKYTEHWPEVRAGEERSFGVSIIGASDYPTVDLALARRLERAEAAASAATVEARSEHDPGAGAEWIEVAGAYAMFDGISSPLTQTFGVGVFEPFGERELDRIEGFFAERGAPTSHEISPFAAPAIWKLLGARGYTPIETSTVLVRPTAQASPPVARPIVVRVIEEDEAPAWTSVAAEGWSSEGAELAAAVEEIGAVIVRTRGVHCFLAELDGRPIAAGALNISNGVALLAGASTVPAARRQGAQSALLRERLDFAAVLGVDLAMVVAQPGSASQRNAQRQGFRPAYVRSKWQLEAAGGEGSSAAAG